jgi:hypothetical protein
MAPTTAQRRRQDPILTNIAHGYMGQDFVGMNLFPAVRVEVRGGKVLVFGREHFRRMSLRRAPGTPKPRVNYEYTDKTFSVVQDAIATPLPEEHIEDAAVMPGIDLGEAFTNMNMETIALQLEIEQAEIARNPANYSPSNTEVLLGADKFSSASANIPRAIDEARNVVRRSIKKKPNIMLVSANADVEIRNNPSVVDRFTYHTAEEIDGGMLARLFGVQRYVVGDAAYDTEAGLNVDCWGDDVILAYVPPMTIGQARYAPSTQVTAAQPSFGYTYVYKNSPLAEEPYWDDDCDSWVFSSKYDRAAVATGMDAGFLFRQVV